MSHADSALTPTQLLIGRACSHCGGSQAGLARAAGVTQQAISKAHKNSAVSPGLAVAIHVATSGAIAKWDLRPDLFDNPLAPPHAGASAEVEAA